MLLFHSLLNLTSQTTTFSGCFINMYFGSGGFDCYMTSQSENAAITSLGGTSYVLSPSYSHLPSARQCVLPSIKSIKASNEVMMGRKKLKGTRIYVNEQLTKKNAALFKKARDLKKQATIDSTWTYNGKVFLKKSQSGSPIEITAEEDLSPFVNMRNN